MTPGTSGIGIRLGRKGASEQAKKDKKTGRYAVERDSSP
jgi:hypothetical protein